MTKHHQAIARLYLYVRILPDIYRVDQYAAPAFGSELGGLTALTNVEDRRRTSCSIWLEGKGHSLCTTVKIKHLLLTCIRVFGLIWPFDFNPWNWQDACDQDLLRDRTLALTCLPANEVLTS
jgi:hypothetical protein